jgi:hypothetical protein
MEHVLQGIMMRQVVKHLFIGYTISIGFKVDEIDTSDGMILTSSLKCSMVSECLRFWTRID